ncbi:MAG: DUF1302 family protein [Cellvibrionaceae bacterium]
MKSLQLISTRVSALVPIMASSIMSPLLLLPTHSLANDWSASWQHELAYERDQRQKNQSQLQLEWNHSPTDNLDITAIARLAWDGESQLYSSESHPDNYSDWNNPLLRDSHGEVALRELYLDAEWFGAYWRLGKQQVVWGQADGLKVLDVITPQSFQEFILDDFDDSRIPLWMLNVEITLSDDSNLQLLWIPDTSYHELAEAGTAFEVTSPLRVPQPPTQATITSITVNAADKPDHWLHDSDVGIRWSSFWKGWDLTANYFYHYRDSAVNYQTLIGEELFIQAQYQRSHLIGFTASNSFGDFTLRTEAGWYSDSYHLSESLAHDSRKGGIEHSQEFSSVVGVDWQGLTDTFISVQWFQSFLSDYHSDITRDQQQQTITLLAERNFANETWTAKIQGQYSLNQQDQLWRFKLTHTLLSNLDLWLASDVFLGDSDGLYGQFDERDRVLVGFELGF